MALPTDPTGPWLSRAGTPRRVFGRGSDDYDLYEQNGEFVLSIEMPGFETDDIDLTWDENRLHVAADREDERREKARTYRRSFRMPTEIVDDDIRARYKNGILDVYLPTVEDETPDGRIIPIET